MPQLRLQRVIVTMVRVPSLPQRNPPLATTTSTLNLLHVPDLVSSISADLDF